RVGGGERLHAVQVHRSDAGIGRRDNRPGGAVPAHGESVARTAVHSRGQVGVADSPRVVGGGGVDILQFVVEVGGIGAGDDAPGGSVPALDQRVGRGRALVVPASYGPCRGRRQRGRAVQRVGDRASVRRRYDAPGGGGLGGVGKDDGEEQAGGGRATCR